MGVKIVAFENRDRDVRRRDLDWPPKPGVRSAQEAVVAKPFGEPAIYNNGRRVVSGRGGGLSARHALTKAAAYEVDAAGRDPALRFLARKIGATIAIATPEWRVAAASAGTLRWRRWGRCQ
jgi:hypothetical protein